MAKYNVAIVYDLYEDEMPESKQKKMLCVYLRNASISNHWQQSCVFLVSGKFTIYKNIVSRLSLNNIFIIYSRLDCGSACNASKLECLTHPTDDEDDNGVDENNEDNIW